MAAAEDNPTGDPNPVAEPSYRGVTKRGSNRYTVGIRHRVLRRRLWLGTFNNAEDAARAYDAMAIELRGVRAKTNFPRPATAVIPSSTFVSSSSAVKGLGFDLNLPPPLDLNMPPPLED